MANALHNIICLEAEWEYRNVKRNNKFSLNTEPLLNWLRTFHGCDIVYRHILNKQDLQYYLNFRYRLDKSIKAWCSTTISGIFSEIDSVKTTEKRWSSSKSGSLWAGSLCCYWHCIRHVLVCSWNKYHRTWNGWDHTSSGINYFIK